MPQPIPPAIDLMACAPEELATWLLTHRFQENAMDVASFLLNCTSTLPNAEEISALLLGDNDGEIEGVENDDEAEVKVDNNITGAASASVETVSKASNTDTSTDTSPSPLLINDTSNSVEVSCINPRGKFLLHLYNNEIALTNPKTPEDKIRFSATNVEHIIWFRKPEDYKKLKQLSSCSGGNGKGNAKDLPGHMVLICLGDGIMFRNKALKQVCFQLPSYPHPSATAVASADDVAEKSGKNKQLLTEKYWWNEFSKTLLANATKGGIIRVHATMDKPELNTGKINFVFRSEGESGRTTTTESMPYVGCYQGFNDGALFPLREGLLFFKPPIFVPRSKLASISCGRGSGGSRFVDLVAQLDADTITDEQEGKKANKQSDTLEFTNIHRDELNGLNDYIHQILIPAMHLDADGVDKAIAKATKSIDCNGDEGNADGSDDDDDDDADVAVAAVVYSSDDDDDNNHNNDTEEGKKRRRPTRAAAKSAREITRTVLQSATGDNDDSDDSVEFQEEEDSSDGSDDTDGSDDQTDVSDEDSSSEGGDFEEDDMDDSDNGQKIKKARVG